LDTLTLIVSLDESGNATGDLYEDSGDGYEYLRNQSLYSSYSAKLAGDTVKVQLFRSESSGQPKPGSSMYTF